MKDKLYDITDSYDIINMVKQDAKDKEINYAI